MQTILFKRKASNKLNHPERPKSIHAATVHLRSLAQAKALIRVIRDLMDGLRPVRVLSGIVAPSRNRALISHPKENPLGCFQHPPDISRPAHEFHN